MMDDHLHMDFEVTAIFLNITWYTARPHMMYLFSSVNNQHQILFMFLHNLLVADKQSNPATVNAQIQHSVNTIPNRERAAHQMRHLELQRCRDEEPLFTTASMHVISSTGMWTYRNYIKCWNNDAFLPD
jgi:hypothetical protein